MPEKEEFMQTEPIKINPLGKNEPILRDMYKEKTNKEPLTKAGNQSKTYIDWKRENFKPMKQVKLKYFEQCSFDIDSGKMTANDCYEQAYDKTIEQGSVYIPPAYRSKKREAEYREKYDLKKLEEAYKTKYGLK